MTGSSGADAESTISFRLTDEQQDLARNIRRFLERHAPVSVARELMVSEEGFDRTVWSQLATELGVTGLHVHEGYGGSGCGYVELGIVLEEMGRVLFPGPFLASAVLATEGIVLSDDAEAMDDYLPGLVAGETFGAFALGDAPGAFSEFAVAAVGERSGGAWSVTGEGLVVLGGDAATLLVVGARTDSGFSLFTVEVEAEGVSRRTEPVLDETRRLARISLARVPARLIGKEGTAWPACEALLDKAAVCLACDALGVAERAMELSVRYAMDRYQFGRPIGSFQAIKHKCADMLVAIELARSATWYATRALTARTPDVSAAASIALSQAAEAAQFVAGECIQIHGGIGFTWEHDAHLYLKRARADGALFGTVAHHRERLLRTLGV